MDDNAVQVFRLVQRSARGFTDERGDNDKQKSSQGQEKNSECRRAKRLRLNLPPAKPRGVPMGTLMPATPTQTLYVTVRRDELRRLQDERDRLRQQVAQLNELLEQARAVDNAISH